MESNEQYDSNHVFDDVSVQPFYRSVVSRLIDMVGIEPGAVVVDLGCGSGAVTEQILERMDPEQGAHIYAIDPSTPELDIARARIRAPYVTFIQGTAKDVTKFVREADVVVLCNVMHLIPAVERSEVCRVVASVLKPGGRFGLNTPFFEGAVLPDTYWFYVRWMQHARRYLAERGVVVQREGTPTALQFLTPEQHREMLEQAGFRNIEIELQRAEFSEKAWDAVSNYSMFIRGALPGVPHELGARALTTGARAALRDLGRESVPRHVLQIACQT
jgi:ubiquinone/menaquinone biosynthesis C-methylase UbiE